MCRTKKAALDFSKSRRDGFDQDQLRKRQFIWQEAWYFCTQPRNSIRKTAVVPSPCASMAAAARGRIRAFMNARPQIGRSLQLLAWAPVALFVTQHLGSIIAIEGRYAIRSSLQSHGFQWLTFGFLQIHAGKLAPSSCILTAKLTLRLHNSQPLTQMRT